MRDIGSQRAWQGQDWLVRRFRLRRGSAVSDSRGSTASDTEPMRDQPQIGGFARTVQVHTTKKKGGVLRITLPRFG